MLQLERKHSWPQLQAVECPARVRRRPRPKPVARLGSLADIAPAMAGVLRARQTLLPHHSISSSEATRIDCGTERLSVFAARMLTTSSNLVGRRTGRSSGCAPRNTFPE